MQLHLKEPHANTYSTPKNNIECRPNGDRLDKTALDSASLCRMYVKITEIAVPSKISVEHCSCRRSRTFSLESVETDYRCSQNKYGNSNSFTELWAKEINFVWSQMTITWSYDQRILWGPLIQECLTFFFFFQVVSTHDATIINYDSFCSVIAS